MQEDKNLKEIQEGDFKAIEEFCTHTWEPLYRFVYYKVQNREEAEDITQETYLKAISYLRSGKVSITSELAFLKTVSLNVIRDRWRRGRHLGICLNIDDVMLEEKTVDDIVEMNEQRETIITALGMLNREQRAVIELRIIKGYTTGETAKIMKKSTGAVRGLQYRALLTLNNILNKNCE